MCIQQSKKHDLGCKTILGKINTLISFGKYTNNSKNIDKKNQKINREDIDCTKI